MNLSAIVTPNVKGQIVIPQAMRKALDVGPKRPLKLSLRGKSLLVQPIVGVVVEEDNNHQLMLDVLEKTQGAWGPASKDELKLKKKRHKLELERAKKSRKAW
jgi:bifunctional DNA-binding transcriptional regulator/antitoxin component of YhaV-PrlF toxin-antitoxin module